MNLTPTIYTFQDIANFEHIIEGSNQNKVFFVFPSDDQVHLEFLYKIINALGYQKDDCLRFPLATNTTIQLIPYLETKNIETLIVFGIPPKQLCLNFEITPYEPIYFSEKTFLFIDNLQDISKNKLLKKNLWLALKEIFKV